MSLFAAHGVMHTCSRGTPLAPIAHRVTPARKSQKYESLDSMIVRHGLSDNFSHLAPEFGTRKLFGMKSNRYRIK